VNVESMVDRVKDFAARGGYTSAQEDDGRWVFYNRGGEIRLYVQGVESHFEVSEAERAEEEGVIFSSSYIEDIEKYLVFRFCMIARYSRRFDSGERWPMITVASSPEKLYKVANGYTITQNTYFYLTENATGIVRIASSKMYLIHFSYYVSMAVDQIFASLSTPEGEPPFYPY
jgi:Immunity protein 61